MSLVQVSIIFRDAEEKEFPRPDEAVYVHMRDGSMYTARYKKDYWVVVIGQVETPIRMHKSEVWAWARMGREGPWKDSGPMPLTVSADSH